ncbi:DddA-like double-stranded DNA deaminase toxin [Saccharopolyspora sp. CA-218241]|uniref:DddA-like double-stranded DNA deaminase toxin n=1 Tax=Saccharopolyspora sp. CA-218241 TaxID=3240027 RepID=UPI003D99C71D
MSAVEELARALSHVEATLTRARESLALAQDLWDERHAALAVLDGTRDPEALDAIQAHTAAGEEMFRGWQLLAQVIATVSAYRETLLVVQAVDDTPPSAPHPSTTGRIPTDAARDRSWIDGVRSRLPGRDGGKGQTTGLAYDRDGNEQRIVSGREEVSERVRIALHNSTAFPEPNPLGAPGVYTHVEAKYAQMMRDAGQTYGVVVLNNDMCFGPRNCAAAARALLPTGATLLVWEPGATKPIVIEGQARP